MALDFVVVKSHPSLLMFVDKLQRANADALSFYPMQVFEREQAAGRLFLGLLNGEPCGYIYAGAIGPVVKCHQVCIQYDARRRLYGAQLVGALEEYAESGRASRISLRCGFDIEANNFWAALGYRVIQHQLGGVRRMRTINIWEKQIAPMLFESVAIEPAVGKQDASIWRKNKQTGLVTQFIRGKSLAHYRAMLVDSESKG